MKKSTPLFFFILIIFVFSCKEVPVKQTIVLSNEAQIDLQGKPISILKSQIDISADGKYISLQNDGNAVPYQLIDQDHDGNWDALFFLADLGAGESKSVEIDWVDESPVFDKQTNIRFGKRDEQGGRVYNKQSDTLLADNIHARLGFQPYQTDGPMWENDKVGYRHYFDGRNAKDLFGKKTPGITPDTVGLGADGSVKDNYHVMEPWGRDVLSVGNSAGIGGIELMIGDQIPRIGNISGDTITNLDNSIFSIRNEGPLYSSFTIDHANWQPLEGKSYDVHENVSIWPGTYAYKNEVSFKGLSGSESLIVGLVNSNTDQPLKTIDVNEDWVALYTHDKQSYDKEWWLGLAIVLPKDHYVTNGRTEGQSQFATSYYGKLNIADEEKISFYSIGVWEYSQDKGFENEGVFVDYLNSFIDQLSSEVSIEIK